jgi:hypothetical protein
MYIGAILFGLHRMTYGNSITFSLLTVFVNRQICLRKLNQQSSFQKDSTQPI